MIRSHRRRAAARSLLLLRLAQACRSCGRLEMISVWLLVLKLLRATAGVKRLTGNELNDDLTQQQEEQENLHTAVSIDSSQLSEMSDVKDPKTDLEEEKQDEHQHNTDDEECLDEHFSEFPDTEKDNSLLATQNKCSDTVNECEGTEEKDESTNQQVDIMVRETEEKEPNLKEPKPSVEPEPDPYAQEQLVEKENHTTISVQAKEPEPQEPQEDRKIEPDSVLEQQIMELVVSDASSESCHDRDDTDDLSDCVHVELAIVLSDSDAEEQWKTMFSPVVDEDEFGAILEAGTSDVMENDQNHIMDEEIDIQSEHKSENAVNEDPTVLTEIVSTLEKPESSTECELENLSYKGSIHYSSLSKISENEVEQNQDVKHSLHRLYASTSDLNKKLPQDFCVIQEMQSENISTEHLDFRMARKQWQKMEEQCKVEQTSQKQSGHGNTCTPMRNLEQSKRDPDSDNLTLADYQYTQFSPCSDDSGLDDTSYRSHYDEPETPVEREIRETMEREECFKRERAMSRPPSVESVKTNPRPATLLMTKTAPEEKRKIYNTREDRCRSQRPSSTTPPTFSLTTSPSKPTYQEMMANNVIIIDPDIQTINPQQMGKHLLSPVTNKFHEWPSDSKNIIILETSNLIIRSASEFCLSSACQETQESTFHNNPFFKLRSHSTLSLVDQEIKEVKQREEEFRKQRAQLYGREKYDTILVSPSSLQNFTYDKPGLPAKCKSSPSSPLKARRMDRSTLSCDQKFPEAPCTRVRRKSALLQRWEATMLANQQQYV